MKLRLPQYSGRDYLVFSIIALPFTIILNTVIFGSRAFSGLSIFLLSTLMTGLVLSLDFLVCGNIAVFLKKRFPAEDQSWRKMGLMIFFFLILTGLFLMLLFRCYEAIAFFDFPFNETTFAWAYFGLGIINIFLTFLFEGLSRFESWKVNMRETEALKKVYRQSRLLSLKNQVNPHFLFNSLNSLSSLIQEDSEKGEQFLDEMSKVYRYMLHNDEEQLVTLETELRFLESYLYILQARHTDGLQVDIRVADKEKEKWIPPLALQTIVENIVSQNAICKDTPLNILFETGDDNTLVIRHNILPKMANDTTEQVEGMDNLVKKYALLNQSRVDIRTTGDRATIKIPLITDKAGVLA